MAQSLLVQDVLVPLWAQDHVRSLFAQTIFEFLFFGSSHFGLGKLLSALFGVLPTLLHLQAGGVDGAIGRTSMFVPSWLEPFWLEHVVATSTVCF